MSPRPRKASDAEIFDALVRVMMRVGPSHLTLSAIAEEAGITAGALVQRFGSKRELMLAHARHAATTGDIGLSAPRSKPTAPLEALRDSIETYAMLAASPESALRNLAYLHRDLADDALHPHLQRMSRTARMHYARLIAEARKLGQLRPDTDVQSLARLVEVTLIGSFVSWAVYREGTARAWLRRDLRAALRPYVVDEQT
jgi:AcrR family transcriptional regulator